MKKIVNVWSYGAGRDSQKLLQIIENGEYPKPDVAIFAKLENEPESTYNQAKDGKLRIEKMGIPFITIRGNEGSQVESAEKVPWKIGTKPGCRFGRMQRRCTRDWKIRPISRGIRSYLGLGKRGRLPKDVQINKWIGFNTNEQSRAYRLEKSGREVEKRVYPLIEIGIGRAETIVEGVEKSACWNCPYRTASEWKRLSEREPLQFEKACRFERDYGKGELWLCRCGVGLEKVVDREDRQMDMFGKGGLT